MSSSMNIVPSNTMSGYSRYGYALTMSHVPYFIPTSVGQAVSGPWVLKTGRNTLAGNEVGWPISDVECWYIDRGVNHSLTCSARIASNVSLANLYWQGDLDNYTSSRYKMCSSSLTYIKVGGNYTGNLTFYVPLVSSNILPITYGGSFPDIYPITTSDAGLTATTDIPGATLNVRTDAEHGYYSVEVTCSNQTVPAGLYKCEMSISNWAEWGISNCGRWSINGGTNNQNTVTFNTTTVNNVQRPAIVAAGTGQAKCIYGSFNLSGSWPFGIYIVGEASLGAGIAYRDYVDNVLFTGSSTPPYRNYFSWYGSSIAYSASCPSADTIWVGKTLPVNREYSVIDDYIPFTTLNTASKSTMRTSTFWGPTASNNITEPTIAYGLARWPVTPTNQSMGSKTFNLANGCCIYGIQIDRCPTPNAAGILMPTTDTGTASAITLGYFLSGSYYAMDTITIPSGSTSIWTQSFYPVFTATPLVARVSGSTAGTTDHVQCFVNYMPSYTLVQAGISGTQDLRVPWKAGAQFPLAACLYNDIYTLLYSASITT